LTPGAALRVVLAGLVLLLPQAGHAFYEWQGPSSHGDVRGLLRGFGSAYRFPGEGGFYPDDSVQGLAVLGRLIAQGRLGESAGYDVNIFQAYIPSGLLVSQEVAGAPIDAERSAALEWNFSDDEYAHLAVDRLNFRWSFDRVDVSLGRQPVNLATTFYFTPNDFFAPFSAQAFYRVYKPGVDAGRAEIRLGGLSGLSLVGVLGYRPDPASETGWSDRPDARRASYLGRLFTVYRDVELAFLLGRVRREGVVGASLQGEWFDWLGVRAEGHVADPRDDGQDRHTELSIGAEHRWESSLNARLEYFHHGRGADAVAGYPLSAGQGGVSYLARRYLAVGASYEFTPLLTGEAVALFNLVDDSWLVSLYSVYSLANETELAVSLGIPVGNDPSGSGIRSEFGLLPASVAVEVRSYF